jgi:hypothetical protein
VGFFITTVFTGTTTLGGTIIVPNKYAFITYLDIQIFFPLGRKDFGVLIPD